MILMMYVFLQIVGESFPISSSGHLVLLEKIYNFLYPASTVVIPPAYDDFLHFFMIVIIVFYFYRKLWRCIFQLVYNLRAFLSFVIACIMTDSLTLAFYCYKDELAVIGKVWQGFLITGLLLVSLRRCVTLQHKQLYSMSLRDAAIIGIAQGLAFLPGVSRFGITYVATRWRGYNSDDSFFYSFLIALPLFGAAALRSIYVMYRDCTFYSDLFSNTMCLVVCVATIMSYFGFKKVGRLIERNRLWYIGYYMIIMSGIAYGIDKVIH